MWTNLELETLFLLNYSHEKILTNQKFLFSNFFFDISSYNLFQYIYFDWIIKIDSQTNIIFKFKTDLILINVISNAFILNEIIKLGIK